MGRWLLHSTLLFFTGIWKGSCRKNQIRQSSKRLWRYFFECFENFDRNVFIPIAFSPFKNLKRSSTYSVFVGVKKNVFSLGFFNDSWNWDLVFTILASSFVSIEFKEWLNLLATFFFQLQVYDLFSDSLV